MLGSLIIKKLIKIQFFPTFFFIIKKLILNLLLFSLFVNAALHLDQMLYLIRLLQFCLFMCLFISSFIELGFSILYCIYKQFDNRNLMCSK